MKTAWTKGTPDNDITPREAANRRLARAAAAESIVLLENDGSLPVAPCAVALYGAGATATIKGGTGSGEVNERYSVSIEQGLKNAGFSVTTDKWLREYEALLETEKRKYSRSLTKKLMQTSADARINIMTDGFRYPFGRKITDNDVLSGGEICVYVIARQTGECSERKLDKFEYDLSQVEIDNLRIAASGYKKTILVINAGGPVDLSPVDDINGINAVIYFCQQGMEGGNGLADVLTGAVAPSGCLSSTWPRKYTDIPNAMEYSYLKGHTEFEEYKEGIYVGYRYYDSFGVRPRYEFGYGLSYTDFEFGLVSAEIDKTQVTVTVSITNAGGYYGKKTVQLYVSVPGGKLNREYQSLAAFGKTDIIAPGQSASIVLRFDISGLSGYDESAACYILEKGDYIIRIGESSEKANVMAVVTLDETSVTEVCRNMCAIDRPLEEIIPATRVTDDTPHIETFGQKRQPVGENAIRLHVSASDIIAKEHDYKPPPLTTDAATDAVMKQIGINDLLKIVTGTGMFDNKPLYKTPGAAAYTTSHLAKKGIPNTALCDGPAGLRLQRTSVKYRNGKVKPVDAAMGVLDSLPGFAKMFMLGNPKRGTLLYQYASAFPVGTALAQTWNTDLIGQIGEAIGGEMDEFGVTFWLAPGMNIQRNPLCGRNYEYYSEDPMLTGKIAAAITRGAQSYEGCYAAIKHFAANNQETNRNHSNSVISERALREIYLKGYRIAVEEGGAKAVMTSYNKLNGVYTPNSYDLCTNILRCEWGFTGVVMSDWFATGKGLAGNGLAIRAGNDLIMPGGRGYRKMLRKDYKAGLVGRDELLASAARVLYAVLKSRGR